MTDQHYGPAAAHGDPRADKAAGPVDAGAPGAGEGSHATAGPFTLRDLVVFGAVVVVFIGSLLPIVRGFGYTNFWMSGNLFFLVMGILLPVLAGVLFAVRRLSPHTTLRIGSLSVDQFASVVAAYATFYFFWGLVASTSIGFIIGFIGAAAMLAATVFAPALPFFAGDFAGRTQIPAHPVARDAVPATAASKSAGAVPSRRSAAKAAVVETASAQPAAGTDHTAGGPAAVVPGSAGYDAAGSEVPEPLGTHAEYAAAPELGQFLGAAAAGGGVAAAAAALPAEQQTVQGAWPAQHDSTAEPEQRAPEAFSAFEPSEASGADQAPETMLNTAVRGRQSAPAEPVSAEPGGAAAGRAEADVVEAAAHEEVGQEPGGAAGAPEPAPVRPESIGATKDPDHAGHAEEPVHEAFWFAVDRRKPIMDEHSGAYLFDVEPGNWILALADRGHDFLVQNTDGKVGVLRDLSNIERAPEGE